MPIPGEHEHGPHPAGEHRPASVTLRAGGGDDVPAGAMLDPANQSLADALRITFRLLIAGMVVLVVLFALSGFQSIREGEAGVRLLFGRKTDDDLPPGFRFSYPYPFGELIKVQRNTRIIELGEDFWPRIDASNRNQSIRELAARAREYLRPGEDGSLITADGNLAHAKWKVEYRRADPGRFVENILAADEEDIVRAAVRRGVVRAVAQTPIDELLKQSSTDEGSVVTRARLIAQEMLDAVDSGIQIERLSLEQKIPHLRAYEDFAKVEAAQAEAAERVQQAQTEARTRLTAMAGAAHAPLAEQISLYERAVETGDAGAQAEVLARINALLEGRPVEIDGRTYEGLASGRVASIINEAEQFRASVYARGQADLAIFRAKLEQFRSNPSVTLQRDWADALQAFMARDSVQVFTLLPGPRTHQILINQDDTFVREMDRQRRLREAQQAQEERRRQQEQRRHQVDTERQTYRQ